MTMSMPLLPEWAQWAWSAVFLGIAVVHVWHAWSMRGQSHWWHIGHTIMAAGMLLMYALPGTHHPGTYRAGLVLFLLVAAAEAVTAVVLRRREGALNPLWTCAVLDKLVMVYMLALPMHGPVLLTSVLVVYLGLQVLAWSFDLWSRLAIVRPAASETSVAAPAGGPAVAVPPQRPALGLTADSTAAVRISLALMAAGMGHMLVASLV
ncbi:DUF5134 domain-containing protein [Bounagaea algeriensis]